MHELSQQMEEQKARKAAEEQAQVKCKINPKEWGQGRSGRFLERKLAGSGLVGGEGAV